MASTSKEPEVIKLEHTRDSIKERITNTLSKYNDILVELNSLVQKRDELKEKSEKANESFIELQRQDTATERFEKEDQEEYTNFFGETINNLLGIFSEKNKENKMLVKSLETAEKKELSDLTKERESKNAEMQKELHELKSIEQEKKNIEEETTKLDGVIKGLNEKKEELETELKDYDKILTELNNSINEYTKDRIMEFQKKYDVTIEEDESTDEIKEILRDGDDDRITPEELRNKFDQIIKPKVGGKSKVPKNLESLETLNKKITNFEQEEFSGENDPNILKQAYEENIKKVTLLKAIRRKLYSRITQLTKSFNALEDSEPNKKIIQQRNEIKDLNDKLEANKQKLLKLQQENTQLEKILSSRQSTKESLDSTIEKLTGDPWEGVEIPEKIQEILKKGRKTLSTDAQRMARLSKQKKEQAAAKGKGQGQGKITGGKRKRRVSRKSKRRTSKKSRKSRRKSRKSVGKSRKSKKGGRRKSGKRSTKKTSRKRSTKKTSRKSRRKRSVRKSRKSKRTSKRASKRTSKKRKSVRRKK